jgi:hypothetical protein
MWFNPWYRGWRNRPRTRSSVASRPSPHRHGRLTLESLEDRTLLSSFTAATVSDLIADINAANAAGGSNTITLTAPTTSPYVLTAVDNATDGPTGLPVISGGGKKVAADSLTIVGSGDTIERSTASGTPDFRLFDVALGAALTLNNLTLQNGHELGSGSSAEGGALFNQGSLVLSAVTVQNNGVVGSVGKPSTNKNNGGAGADAAGGAIWSSGALTCANGTVIQDNFAMGGNGGSAGYGPGSYGGNGGNALGGGVCIAGGTANLSGTSLSANNAQGGQGGQGVFFYDGSEHGGNSGNGEGGGLFVAGGIVTLSGDTIANNGAWGDVAGTLDARDGTGFGGGLYVAGGSATLCNDTVESNTASSFAGRDPFGFGGGIYIASGATVYIDTAAVDSVDPTVVSNNTDSSGTNGSTANIDGTYIPQKG